MVDIWSVVANSLWIFGLMILFASFSRAHWIAIFEDVQFFAVFHYPSLQRATNLGFALLCAGSAATSQVWWQRIVWVVLTVIWLGQLILDTYKASRL